MADETIKIIEFEQVQTIGQLKTNIKELKRELDGLNIGTKEYADTLVELQTNQAALKGAMHDTTYEEDQQKNSFEQTAKAAQGLGESYNALVRRMADLDQQFRSTEDVIQRAQLGAEIKNINAQLKEMDEQRGKYGRNVGNYASALDGLGKSFSATAGSAKSLVAPVNGVTTGLKALSATPAIAILGLLANVLGEIIKAAKSSEEGIEGMTSAFGVFAGIGDMITTLLQGIAKWLGALATAFVNLLDKIGLVNEKMKERQEIAKLEIEIARQQREATMRNAEAEQSIAELRAKAVDKEKYTTEERIAMLKRAGQLEAEIAERSRKAAEAEYNLIVRKNALTKSNAESLKAEADAYARMIQAQTDYANEIRRNTREINAALKEQRAEQEKAEREQLKAERRIISVNKSYWEERLKTAVKGSEDEYTTKLMILEAEHLMEQKAAQADIEDAEEKVKTLQLIEQKYEHEKLRLVEEYANNIQEAERLEMQNRMNTLQQGSWDYLAAAVELKKYELDTLHQLETESNEQFRARQLQAEKEYADAQRNLFSGRVAILQNYAGALNGILSSLADVYEQDAEQSEVAASKAKALRTASAIVQTISGAVGAFMSTWTAPELPLTAKYVLAPLNSAAVLAAGYAQVKSINSVKMGKSSGGMVQAPSVTTSVPQVRTITGQSEEERLNQMASNQRVYLVYSDVEAAQSKRKVQVQETEF